MHQKKLNLKVFLIAFSVVFLFVLTFSQDDAFARKKKRGWEMDGFLRNNTAISTESHLYANNNDKIAAFRNWLRLDFEGTWSRKLKIVVEFQATFEPEYRVEEGLNDEFEWDRYNEYEEFDSWFREVRIDLRPFRGHTIRIGRQIVNWGEALTSRICDVVNPTDNRFDMGAANLEDTRMPQWMIRGVHDVGALGSFEWIVSPFWTDERFRGDRYGASPDPTYMNLTVPALGLVGFVNPGQRFAPNPETRMDHVSPNYYPMLIPAIPGAPDVYAALPGIVVPPPVSSVYTYFSAPVAAAVFGAYNALILGAPVDPLTMAPFPDGYYLLEEPVVTTKSPEAGLGDSRYGFRTSHLLPGGIQGGLMYWHTPGGSVIERGALVGADRLYTSFRPEDDIFGFYGNVSTRFAIFRTEMTYTPDKAYQTYDYINHPDAIDEKDTLKYFIGFWKDYMFRKINPNQSFALILEYVGSAVLDHNDNLHAYGYRTAIEEFDHNFIGQIGTNYNYGMYTYSLTLVYNTQGQGIIQPSFTYVPDILNRNLSFNLKYVAFLANTEDSFAGYGLVRDKDLVILTTEFTLDF